MDSSQNSKRIHDLRSALTRLEFFVQLVEQPHEFQRLAASPEQWASLIASARSAIARLRQELEDSPE